MTMRLLPLPAEQQTGLRARSPQSKAFYWGGTLVVAGDLRVEWARGGSCLTYTH